MYERDFLPLQNVALRRCMNVIFYRLMDVTLYR